MASMEALLKIRADVQGEGKVAALGKALGGLTMTAGKVGGGLTGLLGKAGGVSDALGALVPIASTAGLVAIGKGAIDAADNMRDMSQKTGVSVDQLSRFQQAAKSSGSDINAVSGAMIRLNRNLATKNDGAMDTLRSLGISATDASGKLKSADEIMLEVAAKFATMPDGAEKSAAAMALFGKSGADMVPMLNGGRDSIEKLTATMTTDFANGADELNDKIEAIMGKMLQLGVTVGTAMMPALNAVADAVVGVANVFAALPGPIQAIIGGIAALVAAFVLLAPAITAAISLAGVLSGLQIGATIAGWLGVIGPAIAGITAAFTGLLAWIGGTLIPGLLAFFSGPVGWTVLAVAAVVAMAIAFREPILQFLAWLGENFRTGLAALGQGLYAWFVQPWVDLWNNVLRGPILTLMTWIGETFTWAAQAWYAVLWQLFVQPFVNVWDNVLRVPVTGFVQWLAGAWGGVARGFNAYVVQPISKAWTALIQLLPRAMASAVRLVQGAWTSMLSAVQNAMRGVLQFIANGLNNVGGLVNRLIGAFNALPGPDIPYVPTFNVQPFATGGFVNRPTMGLVGEAGPEYIIPAAKMQGASERFLAGARGSKVFSAGPIGGRGMRSSNQQSLRQAQFSRPPRPPAINVTTGPVLQFNNQLYVTQQDMLRALRTSQNDMLNRLRTPAARISLGLR